MYTKSPLWRRKRFYRLSWSDFDGLLEALVRDISTAGVEFRAVIGIAKGGLVPAVTLATKLGIERFGVLQIHRNSSVKPYSPRDAPRLVWSGLPDRCPQPSLLIDDIVGTGDTMDLATAVLKDQGVTEVFQAALVVNENATNCPHFYSKRVDDWVVFPWETPPRHPATEYT